MFSDDFRRFVTIFYFIFDREMCFARGPLNSLIFKNFSWYLFNSFIEIMKFIEDKSRQVEVFELYLELVVY